MTAILAESGDDGSPFAPTLAVEGTNLPDGTLHGRIVWAVLNLLRQD
jgi:hypothetical protein